MIRPEHQFDIRPDLRKAASTKAESTTAESVIRPKQLVREKPAVSKSGNPGPGPVPKTWAQIRIFFITSLLRH